MNAQQEWNRANEIRNVGEQKGAAAMVLENNVMALVRSRSYSWSSCTASATFPKSVISQAKFGNCDDPNMARTSESSEIVLTISILEVMCDELKRATALAFSQLLKWVDNVGKEAFISQVDPSVMARFRE